MLRYTFNYKPEFHKPGRSFVSDNFRVYVDSHEYIVFDMIHNVKLYSGNQPYVHKPRIFICFYRAHFHFFEDYVSSFSLDLNIELYLYDDAKNQTYSPYDYYVFMQHAPPRYQPNFMLLNTEQITRPEYARQIIEGINGGLTLVDYSLENIDIIRTFGGTPLTLRYQFCQTEIDFLKAHHTQDVDVVFTGTLSSRRMHVITELRKAGVTVDIVNSWGKDRDKRLMRGKILLNIHYRDDYMVYESIRCDRCIFAGMIVVTEKSQHQELVDINPLLIIEDYHNLVVRILAVLANYESEMERLIKARNDVLETIIADRQSDVVRFMEHLGITHIN